ncbi:MAG: GNAT family N-acetyltransferase, partial [Oscillospiraceae bacterium]
MIMRTERLELVPLTVQQLKLWVQDMPALEKELHCYYKAEPMEGFFLDIVKKQLEAAENDEVNYIWHSFWFLIRKQDRVVVGLADFKDVPNESGEVEIGYGLGKEFEHNGYITEAVKMICNFALQHKNVSHIIAETDLNGLASQHILQRCGFKEYKHDTTS